MPHISNAAHIVACVNACAGMDDPAQCIEELRDAANAAINDPLWKQIDQLRAQLAEARADANRTAQILKVAERDYLARIEFLKEQLTETKAALETALQGYSREKHGASGLCCQLRENEKARADKLEAEVGRLNKTISNLMDGGDCK